MLIHIARHIESGSELILPLCHPSAPQRALRMERNVYYAVLMVVELVKCNSISTL